MCNTFQERQDSKKRLTGVGPNQETHLEGEEPVPNTLAAELQTIID